MTASCESVPGRHADRVPHPDVRGDRLLEGLDARAQDEVLALVDVGRRSQDLLADRRVLFPQVEERDGDGGRGHGHDA